MQLVQYGPANFLKHHDKELGMTGTKVVDIKGYCCIGICSKPIKNQIGFAPFLAYEWLAFGAMLMFNAVNAAVFLLLT